MSYERDFYAWANEQAALLREGKLAEADIAHIAEEIESMGQTEKRELVSRLTLLALHLLKWHYQPGLRGPSWRSTIRLQRHDLGRSNFTWVSSGAWTRSAGSPGFVGVA